MVGRYLRDVQGAGLCLAPVGSDLRSRRSQPGENRVSQGSRERQYPVVWRDRGPGARPTALHRSRAICDYADRGRRRPFAAVATPAAAHLKPNAAARLARDIDQPSPASATTSPTSRAISTSAATSASLVRKLTIHGRRYTRPSIAAGAT